MLQLSPEEARVLGALMEKEVTTPEYYPLSLNALVSACNQKSSREPVMQLSDRDAETALRSLDGMELVRADHGSRVERYENRARTVFHLRRDETAILCLLLLRGPQTPGELRSRADRLFQFDDIAQVVTALDRLSNPSSGEDAQRTYSLVRMLPRQPGAREARYAHLLSGDLDPSSAHNTIAAGEQSSSISTRSIGNDRLQALESALLALTARVRHLEDQLGIATNSD